MKGEVGSGKWEVGSENNGPPGPRLFGMYAYGEIGPVGGTGRICFHNDTYAVLLLGG